MTPVSTSEDGRPAFNRAACAGACAGYEPCFVRMGREYEEFRVHDAPRRLNHPIPAIPTNVGIVTPPCLCQAGREKLAQSVTEKLLLETKTYQHEKPPPKFLLIHPRRSRPRGLPLGQ